MICVTISTGQSSEIITDRPDQTESASVVGKHVLQVETGMVFSKMPLEFFGGAGDIKFRDYATTLLRYGINDKVELRLATAYSEVNYTNPSVMDMAGLQPISIGAKFALAKEKRIWPEIALLGHLTLPWVGNKNFTPDHIAPDIRFSFSHTLSDRFSLGYNIGMEWEGDGRTERYLYTIALGASIAGPLSSFVELFGELNEPFGNVDFGLTVLISPDIQFDASYGFAFYYNGDAQFVNAGISARFGGERSQ